LGSECEIVLRTCVVPVDLRGQPATSACSSSGWIDHVEARSPPYVCVRIVAVPMFLVRLRQAGPEFDHSRPLEQQSGWHEHAAFLDGLVEDGPIVLGGTLPNGQTAHAFQAESEEELRAIWSRDPWYESHLILESVERWDIRLGARRAD